MVSSRLQARLYEGGGNLANVWLKEAERRGKRVISIGAETWRPLFLYPREQKSGLSAKKHAGELARNVILWAGAKKPTALRHDTAEAILIGLWGVIQIGWLQELPRELQRR